MEKNFLIVGTQCTGSSPLAQVSIHGHAALDTVEGGRVTNTPGRRPAKRARGEG